MTSSAIDKSDYSFTHTAPGCSRALSRDKTRWWIKCDNPEDVNLMSPPFLADCPHFTLLLRGGHTQSEYCSEGSLCPSQEEVINDVSADRFVDMLESVALEIKSRGNIAHRQGEFTRTVGDYITHANRNQNVDSQTILHVPSLQDHASPSISRYFSSRKRRSTPFDKVADGEHTWCAEVKCDTSALMERMKVTFPKLGKRVIRRYNINTLEEDAISSGNSISGLVPSIPSHDHDLQALEPPGIPEIRVLTGFTEGTTRRIVCTDKEASDGPCLLGITNPKKYQLPRN